MKVQKKVIGELNKCYALATFKDQDGDHLLCAAEKNDPCFMYDFDGNYEAALWPGPGGVMTLEQAPGSPVLLATRKFYSFNDSADAEIVYVQKVDRQWVSKTLVKLPFVHRFGVLRGGSADYLVAATIKSAHAGKDDWSSPGQVWVAELPAKLDGFDEARQLKMTSLATGLFRNHGFCKYHDQGVDIALVGSDQGVYKIQPPQDKDGDWQVECLLDQPASDMLYLDFDHDGERELLVFSPFHGSRLAVYKKIDGQFAEVYRHPEEMPFLHAIWGGQVQGQTVAFVGHRGGRRELLSIQYNPQT
ncbi:MAG TPA: hypothetical protein DCM45_02435, partial [Clostridiales bacterium]|nr:hypothetical protein [Clostridiales bacterium]